MDGTEEHRDLWRKTSRGSGMDESLTKSPVVRTRNEEPRNTHRPLEKRPQENAGISCRFSVPSDLQCQRTHGNAGKVYKRIRDYTNRKEINKHEESMVNPNTTSERYKRAG